MVRNSVPGKLRMRKLNTKRVVAGFALDISSALEVYLKCSWDELVWGSWRGGSYSHFPVNCVFLIPAQISQSQPVLLKFKSHSHFLLFLFHESQPESQCTKSHFPASKKGKSQLPFYPFTTLLWVKGSCSTWLIVLSRHGNLKSECRSAHSSEDETLVESALIQSKCRKPIIEASIIWSRKIHSCRPGSVIIHVAAASSDYSWQVCLFFSDIFFNIFQRNWNPYVR